jgi:hypothetical protein
MPHCEVTLRGRIIILFYAHRLINEYAKYALTDFALMEMFAFPLVEFKRARSRFEQPSILDVGYTEALHA